MQIKTKYNNTISDNNNNNIIRVRLQLRAPTPPRHPLRRRASEHTHARTHTRAIDTTVVCQWPYHNRFTRSVAVLHPAPVPPVLPANRSRHRRAGRVYRYVLPAAALRRPAASSSADLFTRPRRARPGSVRRTSSFHRRPDTDRATVTVTVPPRPSSSP